MEKGEEQPGLNFESSAELNLNKNKTYSFKQQTGVVFFNSSGYWRIKGDTLSLLNHDTSLLNGTPIANQMFLLKKSRLVEIINSKPTNLKLKKN
ncbi:hypothetical protein FW778_13390 [Ginsengibacter hankyongi]|uniref:Uncharacterized protein n=1 Tax=Ginsengibacter hankyongi TaxID=2607284 RepID=A0A5J5III0_9BACT|nr:hypothetical protein [Ginsengibacter hankyongi]KAA9038547.1 hypothetical protein FW778_13390 [Ginsengibacter hankyongi]